MEDAVRPTEQAFKAMFQRGYCTWLNIYESTVVDTKTSVSWWNDLSPLDRAFPYHPRFPDNLAIDASFSNTVLAKGTTSWKTTFKPAISEEEKSCDLSSFDHGFSIQVASDRPTVVVISDSPQLNANHRPTFCQDDDQITLLVLAWTYVLAARWAEIIPGANGPQYSSVEADWYDSDRSVESSLLSALDLGDVDDYAARWWSAVLSRDSGWVASIKSDKGHLLFSPWSIKLGTEYSFTLFRSSKSGPPTGPYPAASFITSLQYLTSYCEYHNIGEQFHAALAATLMLPIAKYDGREIQLPLPRSPRQVSLDMKLAHTIFDWNNNIQQLDRLLTMSCNAVGTKALLCSIFYEPGVECNICGAWLQGSFAFLDSDAVRDPEILMRILLQRDPELGFLWVGAFITGVYKRCLQEARQAWWKIDLEAAAWTGTLMSFIQEPVSIYSCEMEELSRADECRLMYLSHQQSSNVVPLFPFAPFGSTAITDTNIDVRIHAQCHLRHGLYYQSMKWRCRGEQPDTIAPPIASWRIKKGHPSSTNVSIPYEDLDHEDDDASEMVTRNIFTWLRDEYGFPVAERAIREHEWIDNLDSDDDEPLSGGHAHSTAGGNLQGWLLKSMTKRSNSL